MPEKQSAFKQLYMDMLKKGGDFTKVADSKKKITCYVKESFPYFLIADDFFYVPCYFTQKAVDEFKAKNPSVKITDLKLRVIELSNWTLEMVKVNSQEVFTSYGGLELRIIVKEFNLNQKQGVQRVKPEDLARFPVNIYRDDEIKTLIQAYTHSCLAEAVEKGVKDDNLPDISKFSAKSNVTKQGVVSFNSGDKFNSWQFKEGKTPVVSMDSIAKYEKGIKKAATGSSAKAKVVGGKTKAAKKATKGAANIGAAISKQSVGIGKKSTVRRSGQTPRLTPGDKASVASTSRMNKSSIERFKSYVKKVKGKK